MCLQYLHTCLCLPSHSRLRETCCQISSLVGRPPRFLVAVDESADVSAETGTEVVDAAVAEVTAGVEAAEAKAVTGVEVVVPMDRPATIVALRSMYRYQDVVQSGHGTSSHDFRILSALGLSVLSFKMKIISRPIHNGFCRHSRTHVSLPYIGASACRSLSWTKFQ